MQLTFDLVADTICRAVELGLTITDAAGTGDITVINAAPSHPVSGVQAVGRQTNCMTTSCLG